MASVTNWSDFGAQENNLSLFSLFPHLSAMKWWDWMSWSFFECWVLSFKPAFSLSTFPFIKRLFSSSLLFAIRVVFSVYLRLLVFLLAFLVIVSAYKLNKQSDNIQPWRTPFPIWNQSVVPCLVLTVASCPAYRFLRRQARWPGIPISWRISSLLGSAQSKASVSSPF